MKTLMILIPTTDEANVGKARSSAIEYLGTRTIEKGGSYITGTLYLVTTLTAKEKEELTEILDKQDIGVIFIEFTEEEKEIACGKDTLYLEAKLSCP